MSHQRFKILVAVHTDDTCFSAAEPFVTKLHLAMHHHDLEGPLKTIDSLSSRSRSQWRFIYIYITKLCLFLPYLLDCWPICNHQTLFCGTSWPWLSCEKIGIARFSPDQGHSSGSESSLNVFSVSPVFSLPLLFATKLSLLMYCLLLINRPSRVCWCTVCCW